MFPPIPTAQSPPPRPELGPDPQYIATVIRRELQANLSQSVRSGKDAAVVGQPGVVKWFTFDSEYAKTKTKIIRDFEQKRSAYEPPDLTQFYVSRDEDERKVEETKWKAIFVLQSVLDRPQYNLIKLSGADRALYESIFKAEPQKFINLPRFLTVMRTVYKFELANLDRVSDTPMLKMLKRLHRAFYDARGAGMDWRCFILMLRTVQMPDEQTWEHLRFGFALYSSEGSMDPDCSDPVKLGDIKDLFVTLVCQERKRAITDRVNKSWVQVTNIDPEARELALNQTRRGRQQNSIPVPFRIFQRMLEQEALAFLMDAKVTYGKLDPDTWMREAELNWYHPIFSGYLMARRRQHRNVRKLNEFRAQWAGRTLRLFLGSWRVYIWKRRQAKIFLTDRNMRLERDRMRPKFEKLKKWAFNNVVAETIQRYVRGYFGARRADFRRMVFTGVVCFQALLRGYLQRMRDKEAVNRRIWGATEMQRHYRGLRGRTIAQARLWDIYDKGLKAITVERRRLQEARIVDAALIVQRAWRSKKARAELERRRELDAARAMIQGELEQMLIEKERKERVYKQELEEFYRRKKEEFERERLDASKSAAERSKIIAYRRRNADKAKREKTAAAKEKANRLEEARVDNWLKDWEEEANKRAEAHRKFLEENVLGNPMTPEEKKLEKELHKEIKERGKVVIKAADKRNIPMEIPEAEVVAREEVLVKRMNDERLRVRDEMLKAAQEYEDAKAKEDEEERIAFEAERERNREFAATRIQAMGRRYAATRELREIGFRVYKKHFDPRTGAYYYEDKRTGQTQWHKPPSLGSYDVDVKDKWILMTDVEGREYYFNPKTMDMQWDRPAAYRSPREHDKDGDADETTEDGASVMTYDTEASTVAEDVAAALARGDDINAIATTLLEAGEIGGFGRPKSVGDGDETAQLCVRCLQNSAARHCNMCNLSYCQDCFMDAHRSGPFKRHTFNNIQKQLTAS